MISLKINFKKKKRYSLQSCRPWKSLSTMNFNKNEIRGRISVRRLDFGRASSIFKSKMPVIKEIFQPSETLPKKLTFNSKHQIRHKQLY